MDIYKFGLIVLCGIAGIVLVCVKDTVFAALDMPSEMICTKCGAKRRKKSVFSVLLDIIVNCVERVVVAAIGFVVVGIGAVIFIGFQGALVVVFIGVLITIGYACKGVCNSVDQQACERCGNTSFLAPTGLRVDDMSVSEKPICRIKCDSSSGLSHKAQRRLAENATKQKDREAQEGQTKEAKADVKLRLQKLDALKADGIISEEEYIAQRKSIIASI